MSLAERVRHWTDNMKRLVGGRPDWRADREFSYYRVDAHHVTEHRARQDEFARQAHLLGLRIARGMGLLDTNLTGGRVVLDLGAGECCLSEALAFACGAREVWATDAVPKQIWAAAERYAGSPKLKFVVADGRSLPFRDGSFDIVVANLLLHHIEPVEAVLKEVVRVLRPGGRFCAFEPAPVVGGLVHEQTSENEAPISPKRILDALATTGFENARAEYYWSRMETGILGPFSPAYRVQALKPGQAEGSRAAELLRPLEPMALPGLLIDSKCEFAALAREQERRLLDLISSPQGA